MWFPAIVFMGFWWWIATVALIIFLSVLADDCKWGVGTVALGVWLIALSVFGTMPVWPFLLGLTFLSGLQYFGIYMLVGLGWSYFKWFTKLKKFKTAIKKVVKTWDSMALGDQTRPNDRFDHFVNQTIDSETKRAASWNKDEVIFWICYWPFSVIHFAMKDMMRFLVDEVLKGSYIAMRKTILGESVKYLD